MKNEPRVAVLGCGIMGSATALFLAHRGARVRLFDAAPRPMDGASRWNEGKIHLGYLYSADPTLATARRLLGPGLVFKSLTEELIGGRIDEAVTREDDTYLVHRESVVSRDAMERYLDAVSRLAGDHPGASRYLVDLTVVHPRRLTAAEVANDYDAANIVAGFRVPERSVSTTWLADRIVGALVAEPRIELALETRVVSVRPAKDSLDGPLLVETSGGVEGPFDAVVNALWAGRLAVDDRLGLRPVAEWSHRFRLSLFMRTRAPVALPSTVVATGPFGDVKNYDGRNLYLSWYPAGLIAEGHGVSPPPLPRLDEAERLRIASETFRRLGQVIPAVRGLEASLERLELQGGWVFAIGTGSLRDAGASLHRRDRIGIERRGSYFSVDTGKYSIAPWLAREIAGAIAGK